MAYKACIHHQSVLTIIIILNKTTWFSSAKIPFKNEIVYLWTEEGLNLLNNGLIYNHIGERINNISLSLIFLF